MLDKEQQEELDKLLVKVECDFIIDKIKKGQTDSFSRFLKLKRLEYKLSARGLGEKSGVSHSEIHRLETGQRKNPSIKTLIKLSKALEFNINDVIKYFE